MTVHILLLQVRVRLGHFDPVGPLQAIAPSAICSDYAIATSMVQPRHELRARGGADGLYKIPITDTKPHQISRRSRTPSTGERDHMSPRGLQFCLIASV